MARLARRQRCARRSNRQLDRAGQKKSEQPALNRERVEPGRDRQDGAAALSRAVPVLCERWRAELPTLSTQLRFVSRRAVQHRELRAADDDGGTSGRSYAGGFRPHLWRSASLQQPSRPSARTADPRMPTVTADELESERE